MKLILDTPLTLALALALALASAPPYLSIKVAPRFRYPKPDISISRIYR